MAGPDSEITSLLEPPDPFTHVHVGYIGEFHPIARGGLTISKDGSPDEFRKIYAVRMRTCYLLAI